MLAQPQPYANPEKFKSESHMIARMTDNVVSVLTRNDGIHTQTVLHSNLAICSSSPLSLEAFALRFFMLSTSLLVQKLRQRLTGSNLL